MLNKADIVAARSLFSELLRRRGLRTSSLPVDIVHGETEIFLALFALIDKSYLCDNDVCVVLRRESVPVSSLRERLHAARDWFGLYCAKALNDDVNEDDYRSYKNHADRHIVSLGHAFAKSEQEQKNTSVRQQADWPVRAAAGVVQSLAGLL